MARKLSIRLVMMMALAVTLARTEAEEAQSTEPATAVARLQDEAARLKPLVRGQAVKEFLDATAHLPHVAPRKVYRNKSAGRAYTPQQYEQLDPDARAACTEHEYDETFFYYTGYGCPLIYARPLDIYAESAQRESVAGLHILDFGYGSIGHLRLLAACGAEVVGVEVEPVFHALYRAPEDQGEIRAPGKPAGRLTLLHGRYPADAEVSTAVGGQYDLIISKNVLKRGYIHPEREADERQLVRLGVDDETFLRALYAALKPGGHVLIYNISPAQSPPDKPYIPWADGRCPFQRDLVERAGFEIRTWDQEDHTAVYDIWFALGLEAGQSREELSKDLFAHYTLLRRPPA